MLKKLYTAIDGLTERIGRIAAWAIVLSILVSSGNAISRKLFGLSSNAMLELQWYLFGLAFLFSAAWTLSRDEHTRIDVVASRFRQRARDWIDLIGHLVFFMPFVGIMIWKSIPWFLRSFESGEVSANANGLIIWPAKFIVLAGFALLAIQGVSEIVKSALRLSGQVIPAHGKDDVEGEDGHDD